MSFILLTVLPPKPPAFLLPPEILSRGTQIVIRKGGMMPEQTGRPVSALYYIKDGMLRTFRSSHCGDRKTLHLIGRGYFIFESYFLNGQPLQLDGSVVRDLTLVKFDNSVAHELMESNTNFLQHLLRGVAVKMHLMGAELVSMAYDTPLTRLKVCLASLAALEQEGASSVRIVQTELAEIMGMHRVSVGRLLMQLQNDGEIEVHRGYIVLKESFFTGEDLQNWELLSNMQSSET